MYSLTNKSKEQAVEGVRNIPENTLLGSPENGLVDALINQFRLDVPVICEGRIHVEPTETKSMWLATDTARLRMALATFQVENGRHSHFRLKAIRTFWMEFRRCVILFHTICQSLMEQSY